MAFHKLPEMSFPGLGHATLVDHYTFSVRKRVLDHFDKILVGLCIGYRLTRDIGRPIIGNDIRRALDLPVQARSARTMVARVRARAPAGSGAYAVMLPITRLPARAA